MGKSIGNTPLVELKNIPKEGGRYADNPDFRLFAKVEGENLGGSIKDRVAQAILDDAEKKGVLKKGGVVIEATSGNTGIGRALCCRLRGYQAKIFMPDTMSVERQEMIKAQGGEVLLTDGKKGMSGAVEKALETLKNTPNAILADQFNNPVCWTAHYASTGPEIWAQTQGKIDIFVACVGTGGTITGVGKYLKEKNKNIRVVAVEPSASPLLSKAFRKEGRSPSHGQSTPPGAKEALSAIKRSNACTSACLAATKRSSPVMAAPSCPHLRPRHGGL